jgi:hypothetical protein
MTFAFLIVLIAAVIGSAGMVGVFAWLHQRISRLEDPSPVERKRLLSENTSLHEQVETMRSEMRELAERVDFTEKLLERKSPDRSIGPSETE